MPLLWKNGTAGHAYGQLSVPLENYSDIQLIRSLRDEELLISTQNTLTGDDVTPCADPESFVRGGPNLIVFLVDEGI